MQVQSGYDNIQGLAPVQAGNIEKVSSQSAVSEVENEKSSSLVISDDLTIHKSSLSSQIEKINGGIALTAVAQNGIMAQKGILEEVKSEVLKIDDTLAEDEKNATIENINNRLNKFNDIAQNTQYKGQFPLKTADDTSDDISISTQNSIIPLEKADTASIVQEVTGSVSDFLLNNASQESVLNSLEESMGKLNVYENNFAKASTDMKEDIKNSIEAQRELSSSSSRLKNIDFGKESSDFNKTNLQSQIGYLMQTQANAQQAKNIVLLS